MSDSFVPPWTVAPPGSSVHGISQATILEWVAISFSRGSSNPGIEPASSVLAGRFFTTSTTWEPHFYPAAPNPHIPHPFLPAWVLFLTVYFDLSINQNLALPKASSNLSSSTWYQPILPAVEARSSNFWTTGEFPFCGVSKYIPLCIVAFIWVC